MLSCRSSRWSPWFAPIRAEDARATRPPRSTHIYKMLRRGHVVHLAASPQENELVRDTDQGAPSLDSPPSRTPWPKSSIYTHRANVWQSKQINQLQINSNSGAMAQVGTGCGPLELIEHFRAARVVTGSSQHMHCGHARICMLVSQNTDHPSPSHSQAPAAVALNGYQYRRPASIHTQRPEHMANAAFWCYIYTHTQPATSLREWTPAAPAERCRTKSPGRHNQPRPLELWTFPCMRA